MDLNGIEEVVERPDRDSLAAFRPGDAWLGGGTWLFSEPQPGLTRLLDLRGFGWTPLSADADGLSIAATCTIAELERWTPPRDWRAAAIVSPCCRALLGSFKVWNGATVGGNVCLALPAGPMTALAVALDGACLIWGPDGDRVLPAGDVVLGERRTALRPGEALREIRLPAAALRRRAVMRQISLTPQGRSGALLIGTLGDGTLGDATLDHGTLGDGTLGDGGAFRLTVTGSTVRPLVFSYPDLPSRDALRGDLAAIPDEAVFDDLHGRPAWRRAVTAHLADEILDELSPR